MTTFDILERVKAIEKLYRSEITSRDELNTMIAFTKLIRDLERKVKEEELR